VLNSKVKIAKMNVRMDVVFGGLVANFVPKIVKGIQTRRGCFGRIKERAARGPD
jgi:hypothetical protein